MFGSRLALLISCLVLLPSGGGAQLRPNPHDQAGRLIGALQLSGFQLNAARDFVIVEMAHGREPRAALQEWVRDQARRGVAIHCRPGAADCVASP